jgi:hypothetical protein
MLCTEGIFGMLFDPALNSLPQRTPSLLIGFQWRFGVDLLACPHYRLCSIQHVTRDQTVTASTSAWADHCQY